MQRFARRLASWLVLAGSLAGCRAWVETEPKPAHGHRVDTTRTPIQVSERQEGPTRVHMLPVADGVEVRAGSTSYCRTTTLTPRLADRTIQHDMGFGGVFGQTVLAIGAVILVPAGSYLVAQPCGIPEAAGAVCFDQVERASTMLGAAALVAGGLMGTLFVANAIGTVDEEEVVNVTPERRLSRWQSCGYTAAAHLPVEIRLADGKKLRATTNEDGVARFTLSESDARVAQLKLGARPAGATERRD
jgi:hypothetical protein